MRTSSPAVRTVGCRLSFEVDPGGASLVLQVAAARQADEVASEELHVEAEGGPLPVEVVELERPTGSRYHVVQVPSGEVTVRYEATVRPTWRPQSAPEGLLDPETVAHLRPSRYCPSDALLAFALAELGDLAPDADRPGAVAAWVFERLAYDVDATSPTGGAVETLLSGRGVCRDFAHLTVALCRALEIPARLVAVYAPGLTPMDFHAVVEAQVDGAWQVLDPTRLAPRGSLVRIATGRDAADTAFATTLHGYAALTG
ncbi:MAG: transglutaminase domain-containing protein, partial [Acidimicrobiales bacterium]